MISLTDCLCKEDYKYCKAEKFCRVKRSKENCNESPLRQGSKLEIGGNCEKYEIVRIHKIYSFSNFQIRSVINYNHSLYNESLKFPPLSNFKML